MSGQSKQAGSSTSTIELGHTYAPDRLVRLAAGNDGDLYSPDLDRWFDDTPEAARIKEIAAGLNLEGAVKVALIDDVAARKEQQNSQDSWRWQMFINSSYESVRLGTGAEVIQFEAALEQDGRALNDTLAQMDLPQGYRLSTDGRKLIVGSGKDRFSIPLKGFKGVDDPTHPSCQVLDLAWLQKRLTMTPHAITILPKGYEEQQQGVEVLADLAGIDPDSFETIYVDDAA